MIDSPTLVLAPMQDVTNLPFMRVMQQFGGPDYYVTEYFRVHADYKVEKKILRSITENSTGRPVYAQLIGQDIASLTACSRQTVNSILTSLREDGAIDFDRRKLILKNRNELLKLSE